MNGKKHVYTQQLRKSRKHFVRDAFFSSFIYYSLCWRECVDLAKKIRCLLREMGHLIARTPL